MTTHLARSGAVLALAVGFWLGSNTAARADNLDQKLVDQASKILAALEKNGYHNVGIIRARVQIGSREPSFTVGPINGNLPTRLENALVMHLGSEPKIGIIHNASKAASDAKIGSWYTVPAERKKLFDVNYPLAWGDKKVKASAIVAPLVKVSADFGKVTVVLEAFTSEKPGTMVHLTDVAVETDTQMLRDLAKSYNVVMRGLKDKSGTNVRKLAIQQVKARDEETNPPMPNPNPTPTPMPVAAGNSTTVGDLEFKLMYDGAPVEIKGSEIVCPDPGKPIVFSLTNKGPKRIGVDVKLNGTSLFKEQTEPAETCRVWVIDDGKTSNLEGFYDGANVQKFKILIGEEAATQRTQLGEKAGLIEITVFPEADTAPPPSADGLQISRNLRALKAKEEKAARRDLHTLQNTLLKRNLLKREVKMVKEDGRTIKRELIVKDTAAEATAAAELKEVDFKKGTQAPASTTLKLIPKSAPPPAATEEEKK
jgi:hypothetical protein